MIQQLVNLLSGKIESFKLFSYQVFSASLINNNAMPAFSHFTEYLFKFKYVNNYPSIQ